MPSSDRIRMQLNVEVAEDWWLYPDTRKTLREDEGFTDEQIDQMVAKAKLRAKHQRETTTPMDDGALLADCSCGGTYSVPQGGDEYAALEAAHVTHCAEEATP